LDQRPPDQAETLRRNSRLLEEKLADFGVKGRVVEVAPGPVVTVYEFKPAPGVKISKVAGLADDLALNLRATSIRIVAPIPGKAAIGIEIPNASRETVFLRELLASPAYQQSPSPITIALGKDILGLPVVEDLGGMPHLLIAGATGSGKSVFINCLVLSLLYKAGPDLVRLLMVDPKRIELSTYDRIPHLLHPIITDPAQAAAALRWAVGEMERRYELLAWMGVRNIAGFNRRLAQGKLPPPPEDRDLGEIAHLPYLVIIIDELADLMMAASKEVEALITRLAQMARAAGIHLVLATQRPSVDVITGLIKANFPARISFKVTSRVDSRTILDTQGAEHLLGMGDMLLSRPGHSGLLRLHGALVTDGEIQRVVDYVRAQGHPQYDQSVVQSVDEGGDTPEEDDQPDELYPQAVALVKQSGQASISYLQRRLRVGYNRAARMIEHMEREGIVGPSDGSRPREVLIRE
jgi:S-DNA-T family DNA segregation ATPase FtsK/SpoIIIE